MTASMITFIILIGLFALVSLLPFFIKFKEPIWLNYLKMAVLIALVGMVLNLGLMHFGYRLKGAYTSWILALVFWGGTLLIFGFSKSPKTQMLAGLLAIPTYGMALLAVVYKPTLLVFYFFWLLAQPPLATSQVNEEYHIEIRDGGFLACGESLYVMQSHYGVFNKEIYVGNNHCVQGIHKVEMLEHNSEKFVFLIHHDGNALKENPYTYTVHRPENP